MTKFAMETANIPQPKKACISKSQNAKHFIQYQGYWLSFTLNSFHKAKCIAAEQ
jgi:hypothetical protein